jgi:hypothetical protein
MPPAMAWTEEQPQWSTATTLGLKMIDLPSGEETRTASLGTNAEMMGIGTSGPRGKWPPRVRRHLHDQRERGSYKSGPSK